jgi:PAS domain S-box-containing protein
LLEEDGVVPGNAASPKQGRAPRTGLSGAGAASFLRLVPDAVLCADEEGRVIFLNAAGEALFGIRSADVIASPVGALIEGWARLQGSARRRQVETRARRADGVRLPVEISILSWRERGRNFVGAVIGSILDRTLCEAMLEEAHAEARQAEAEMRMAHRRLSEVIDLQPHAICVLDPNDRYLLWNRKYSELYPEIAEMLRPGMVFWDVLRASVASGRMPEATDDPDVWLAARVAKHALPSLQQEQAFRDGRWIRYDGRRLSDGSTIGMRVDITDLKRREESFRLLFDANPAPMLVVDAESLRITAVNDAAISHYGFARETFLHMDASDLHAASESGLARRALARAWSSDEVSRVWRHRVASGWRDFSHDANTHPCLGRPAFHARRHRRCEREDAGRGAHLLPRPSRRADRACQPHPLPRSAR